MEMSVVRWLHALCVSEGVGAGPLRRPGVVGIGYGGHREAVLVVQVHRRNW